MVLSTMHDKVKVTGDQRLKPQVHTMYDHTKGGVDIVDLMSTMHSTRIKCRRWPINVLAFLLDTARTNAKTILQDNNVKMSNFQFTYELGKALCLPLIKRRYESNNGLQIDVLQKMRRVLGIQEVNRGTTPTSEAKKQGRCGKCVEELVGTANYKTGRYDLNNKLKGKCVVCGTFCAKNT